MIEILHQNIKEKIHLKWLRWDEKQRCKTQGVCAIVGPGPFAQIHNTPLALLRDHLKGGAGHDAKHDRSNRGARFTLIGEWDNDLGPGAVLRFKYGNKM